MSLVKLLKKRNSGFTLVELIVVIAIIAVLTAVMAPKYIQFVEKSKISVDMDTASVIESAVSVLCADGTISASDSDYVTWDISAGLVGEGKDEVEAITGAISAALSEKAKSSGNIVYCVTFNAGTPIVTTNVNYRAWDD